MKKKLLYIINLSNLFVSMKEETIGILSDSSNEHMEEKKILNEVIFDYYTLVYNYINFIQMEFNLDLIIINRETRKNMIKYFKEFLDLDRKEMFNFNNDLNIKTQKKIFEDLKMKKNEYIKSKEKDSIILFLEEMKIYINIHEKIISLKETLNITENLRITRIKKELKKICSLITPDLINENNKLKEIEKNLYGIIQEENKNSCRKTGDTNSIYEKEHYNEYELNELEEEVINVDNILEENPWLMNEYYNQDYFEKYPNNENELMQKKQHNELMMEHYMQKEKPPYNENELMQEEKPPYNENEEEKEGINSVYNSHEIIKGKKLNMEDNDSLFEIKERNKTKQIKKPSKKEIKQIIKKPNEIIEKPDDFINDSEISEDLNNNENLELYLTDIKDYIKLYEKALYLNLKSLKNIRYNTIQSFKKFLHSDSKTISNIIKFLIAVVANKPKNKSKSLYIIFEERDSTIKFLKEIHEFIIIKKKIIDLEKDFKIVEPITINHIQNFLENIVNFTNEEIINENNRLEEIYNKLKMEIGNQTKKEAYYAKRNFIKNTKSSEEADLLIKKLEEKYGFNQVTDNIIKEEEEPNNLFEVNKNK